MKKNQTTTWLVLAIGAGLLLFAFSSAAAGALTITIAAGLMAGIKTPANGTVVLIPPSGAQWISGQASTGTLAPRALPLPTGTASVSGGVIAGNWTIQVTPGMSVAVQWIDASGTSQNTFLTFA